MTKVKALILKSILTTAAWILFCPILVSAYFMDNVHGVRPAGMGEAFVSISDDTNAMLFNPAGLVQIDQLELQGMFSELYAGLDDRIYNQKKDRIGYSLAALAVPDEALAGVVGLAWNQFYSLLYHENVFYLSYARSLWPQYGLSAGLTMKVLHWQVALNETVDPVVWAPYTDLSKIGVTADLGILALPWPGWRFGFAVDNVIPVDMGLTTEATVPQVYRLGTTYTIPWHPEPLDSIISIVEVNARKGLYNAKVGLESWWYQGTFALRLGANIDQFTTGFGFRYAVPNSPLGVQLDYAFSYPFQIMDSFGSHRGGLTLYWDLKYQKKQLERQEARENRALAQTEELEKAYEKLRIAQIQVTKKEQEVQTAQSALADAQAAFTAASVEARQTKSVSDKNQAASFPVNKRDDLVIGYETEVFSDLAYTQDVRQKAQDIELFLEKMTGLDLKPRGFTKREELRNAFINGEIDLAVPFGQLFQKLHARGVAHPIATVLINGKQAQKYCLVVSDDSRLEKPADLKNKRLGFFTWESLKTLKTDIYQSDRNFRPELFFAEIKPLKNTRGSLFDLHVGTVDAIWGPEYLLSVYKMNQATLTKGLKVISWSKSEVKNNPPVFMRNHLNKSKMEKIKLLKEALFALHQEQEGKAFLDFFHFDKLVPYRPGD